MTHNDRIGDGTDSPARIQTSRRSVVKAIGAGAAVAGLGVGAASPATAAVDAPMDEFVETDGTEFVVDGEPVYFNGSNNFWITHEYDGTEQRIDDVLDLYADLGIDLVRIWAHGEGKEGPLALQPEPGEYNEDALENLDYLIEAARERGMRIIATLVDNWVHEGGMVQYASWVTGDDFDPDNYDYPTGLHEVFYTDEEARDLYKNHVETIVTRENSISGVEWRNDPTIAMWELANEPRLETDWAYGQDAQFDRQAGEHREILGDWIREMSSFVKDLDDNHLVSTGSEGHYHRDGEEYPYGTWGGQDYVGHHDIDAIDVASFHWYPDHWNMELDHGTQWITEHVEDAHEQLNKPAYLGEFNVNVNDHGLETKNQYLEEWYAAADAVDCNAVLPWQIVLEDTEDHDGFQLYASESGDIIENYADVAAEKSGDWEDTPTDAIEVGEYDVVDSNDDGLYDDFDGDGETSHDDVTAFFENIDSDAVRSNPDAFDFDGNGGIGFGDVVDLLRRV